MPDVVPFWTPGESLTCHVGADVTGGRFVRISGARVNDNPQVGPCGAGQAVAGVAARDKAAGQKVLVYSKPGQIIPVRCGAALAAGTKVMSDATGQAVAYVAGAGVHVAGVLWDDVANGADGLVRLLPGDGALT